MIEEPLFWTVEEVAEALRVKPTTIYKWASMRPPRIPCVKPGGKLLFPRVDVLKALEAGKEGN